jgi:hypothetical protein
MMGHGVSLLAYLHHDAEHCRVGPRIPAVPGVQLIAQHEAQCGRGRRARARPVLAFEGIERLLYPLVPALG